MSYCVYACDLPFAGAGAGMSTQLPTLLKPSIADSVRRKDMNALNSSISDSSLHTDLLLTRFIYSLRICNILAWIIFGAPD